MKSHRLDPHPQEIELKLALPTSDPQGLAKRLARTPLLARRKATQLQLHNIYFDTPEQRLHQERVALRLRVAAHSPQRLGPEPAGRMGGRRARRRTGKAGA
jgi:adenylate cyclase class IV